MHILFRSATNISTMAYVEHILDSIFKFASRHSERESERKNETCSEMLFVTSTS